MLQLLYGIQAHRPSEFRAFLPGSLNRETGDEVPFRIIPILRHFGYPAPLLEFSTKALVSLWFAYENPEPPEDRILYLLDQKKLFKTWKFAPTGLCTAEFKAKDPLNLLDFFVPIKFTEPQLAIVSARETAQSAAYIYSLLHDNESFIRQLEILAAKIDEEPPTYLHRFRLPFELRERVLADLAKQGIHRASIYPDDASMVQYLKERAFL